MADYAAVLCQVSQANTPSVQTIATVLAANSGRAAFAVQNQGTNPLFIALGTGATLTAFHVSLKGGTTPFDGNGGIYEQRNGAVFQGIVTSTGTAPSYTALEL